MAKLYAEFMNTIEAVRNKEQDIRNEIEVLQKMTSKDNIYVEFDGYDVEIKARSYVVAALVKELELKISELAKIEVNLLSVLKEVEDIDL